MKINDAQLIVSAVDKKQYPSEQKKEFVLLGRSNVGKSSFINTLIGRKNLARTSNQPGKTQTMNFYRIDNPVEDFYFVDMPGYGYAKVSKKQREKWGQMIEKYLLDNDNVRKVFLLVDAKVGSTEDDRLMYDWLKYYGIDPVVVATKTDKLPKSKVAGQLNKIKKEMGLKEDFLLPFSSSKKEGTSKVWEIIESELN